MSKKELDLLLGPIYRRTAVESSPDEKPEDGCCMSCRLFIEKESWWNQREGLWVCGGCALKSPNIFHKQASVQVLLNRKRKREEKDTDEEDVKDGKVDGKKEEEKNGKEEKKSDAKEGDAEKPNRPKPEDGKCTTCGVMPLKWHVRREDVIDFWVCGRCMYCSEDAFRDMLKTPLPPAEVDEKPAKKARVDGDE